MARLVETGAAWLDERRRTLAIDRERVGLEQSITQLMQGPGVVMLIGAADTGKTTVGKALLTAIVQAGFTAAYVDADLDQSTVGPPACVGLKWVNTMRDIEELGTADELRFVGSTTPEGVVLPHVVATAALVDVARAADYVVLDTTGVVAGVVGETLKYHTTELCQPRLVVAMHRGGEMDPIVSMLERFLGVESMKVASDPMRTVMTPSERNTNRAAGFRRELEEPIAQWRVQRGVFAPSLPEEFDYEKLDQMLVGVQGFGGKCLGLGVLEYKDHQLRVVTRHGDDMSGLRLGSLRVDRSSFATVRVRLRQLIFGV